MKTLLSLICLLFLSLGLAAQTPQTQPAFKIQLKDGTSLNVASLRRDGTNIMVPLPTGSGEGGYPISKIARIEFPTPPQIADTEKLLSQGKTAPALMKIEPILRFHEPYRDIPGSFWAAAAFLKMKAFLSLQRNQEADVLLSQIASSAGTDPALADRVKIEKAAILARQGKDLEAVTVYDQIIEKNTDAETLALAWLNKGNSLLALKNYDPAVLAFLHLPVFYPDQTTLQPPAMLGAARAWVGLDDTASAESSFKALIDQFPASPEAAIAQKEIKKL